MQQRSLGTTGLTVSALGLGAGQIGQDFVTVDRAREVVDAALEVGVTLIDTARGYGSSEQHLGEVLRGRRDRVVLSSKGGYGAEGADDWTPQAVTLGIEQALRRLQTDHIDIFHLHSCPMQPVRDDLIAALQAARDAGKISVAAYSGDNADLTAAITASEGDSGFGSVETSVSIADQWSLHHALPLAAASGLGVIAKRPTANHIWCHDRRPDGVYGETYWDRLQRLAYDVQMPMDELALRFTAFAAGVSSAIAGTANPDHVRHNAVLVEKGPLPADVLAHVEARWSAVGADWPGEV